MKISFTGIDNLQIAKNKHSQVAYGFYPSITGEVKKGEMEINEYKIRVDLTDDVFGHDYSDCLTVMTKAEGGLNTGYFRNPQKIELHMTKHDVLDDDIFKDYSFSTFKINGKNIPLTGPKKLGLYTYLAKLTRELKKQFKLSESQQEIIDLFNQSIQTEAERFIDTMQ